MSAPQLSGEPNRFERRRRRNREALIDAAIELFQARGLRATRLEEICERADVSPRTFFNHFETREHLYEAIARQRAAEFAAALDAAAADPRPLASRLPEFFARVGAYLDERPLYRELVGVMLRLGVEGDSEIARQNTLGLAARRFVDDGRARGEITASHPPEVLADLLLGALNTALCNWSASEGFPLDANLEPAARALVDLFTPREAPHA